MTVEIVQGNGVQGLKWGSNLVLAVAQDAVWPLGHGWWGYRCGDEGGVVSPHGEAVQALRFPVRWTGFASLSDEDELSCVLEDDVSVVGYIRQQFPDAHLYFGTLCQRAEWWAEQVLPHLWNEDEQPAELDLPTIDGHTLMLKSDGTWTLLEANLMENHTLLRMSDDEWQSVHDSHLQPVDEYDLLRWRLRLTGDAPGDDTWLGQRVAHIQEEKELSDYLETVLSEHGISSQEAQVHESLPEYREFVLADLPTEIRDACEAHLGQVTLYELRVEQVEQLIHLAWLWANGYVFYDEAEGFHWVDGRYEFDNSWFDNHVIDYIRMEYELHELEPLLIQSPSSKAATDNQEAI